MTGVPRLLPSSCIVAGLLLLAAVGWLDGRAAGRQDGSRGVLRATAAVPSSRPVLQSSRPAVLPSTDDLADAAEALLRAGRPWRATELLDSALRDSAGRTPRLVLLGARAAAGWGGWQRVERLLADARWLDSLEGDGHALLARAALDRREGSLAAARARRALMTATDATRGDRTLLLARALDRLNRRDSAAALYRAAAAALPSIADWLLLRAAGITDDADQRRELLRRVRVPAATTRVGWTEAGARERAGARQDAARLYDSLGARITALRLRLQTAANATARTGLRRELVTLLAPRLGPDDTRGAIALLDGRFTPLTAQEQLIVARRAAAIGQSRRAAAGYAVAARAGLLTAQDRLSYASVQVRLGRHEEALTQLARIRNHPLAAEAAYQRARTLMLMGNVERALRELPSVAARFPKDTTAAASALYLHGDLMMDRGADQDARESFLQVATRYPTSGYASRARLRAALITLQLGDEAAAAAAFDALRAAPGGRETAAAAYWAGRAWAAMGDTGAAIVRWRAALGGNQDYYALLAARALGEPFWTAPPPSHAPEPPGAVADAVARIEHLDALGLNSEARFEWNWTLRESERTASTVSVATLLAGAGFTGRAFRLITRGGLRDPMSDGTVVRLLYPLPRRDALETEAARNGLDPLLVAALIRQESAFDPAATSRADARGLMQILPAVGAALARAAGITEWDPVLLYEPEVSMTLGTRHLAAMLEQYPTLEHALAAYNAGGSRVVRWLRTRGVEDDPALFVERIPYAETRDYVRRVVVNLARYKILYGP
ncbi:MAG TPA: transglycosylase SLT domain-containing protein [Gemmatimonadales bacterium]